MPPTTKSKRSRSTTDSSKASKSPTKPSEKPAATRPYTRPKTPPITNYTTGLKWFHSHIDHEQQRGVDYSDKTFSLDRMRCLLGAMGSPHEQLNIVHIAGTKGKGSTCQMLAAMLGNTDYAVGLYTSPHLIDLRERITIGGHMISYADAADIFKRIAAAEKKLDEDLTCFEILTAAAFIYFADQAVDLVLLETGLGGRLDCTNVCEPLITAMTQVSLDHTHMLGETLEAIAREKAGIVKPNVPLITIKQPPEVMEVLKERCEEVGAPLLVTGDDLDFSYRFESNRELGPHTRVCLTTDRSRFEHLAVPLKGEHQALNCGLALSILDGLKAHSYELPELKIIDGLAETQADGRMEQVWDSPRVFIDGAHNPASLQALIRALGAHINYDSLVVIFGCAVDKDVTGMLEQVALGADKVVFTQAKSNGRASEPRSLLKQFAEVSPKMAQQASNLDEAVRVAARAVSREDIIIVTGSFYLAGEARKFFQDLGAARAKKRAAK